MRAKKENGWANRPRNPKRHEDGLQNQLRRLLNKPNHLHQNLLDLFNRSNLLLTMTMMTFPRVQGSGLRRSRHHYRLLRKRVARREGRVVSRNGNSRRENGTRRCSRTRREKMRKRMMMIGILKGDEVCYIYLSEMQGFFPLWKLHRYTFGNVYLLFTLKYENMVFSCLFAPRSEEEPAYSHFDRPKCSGSVQNYAYMFENVSKIGNQSFYITST